MLSGILVKVKRLLHSGILQLMCYLILECMYTYFDWLRLGNDEERLAHRIHQFIHLRHHHRHSRPISQRQSRYSRPDSVVNNQPSEQSIIANNNRNGTSNSINVLPPEFVLDYEILAR